MKADSSIFFPGQLTKLKAEETIRLYFEPICRSKAHPDPFHRAGAVRITTVHAAPVRVRIPPVPAPAKVVPRDARR